MKEQQHKRCVLTVSLCLICLSLVTVSFANSLAIGRYLAVDVKPQRQQQHLLQQQLQIRFPQNILTLKQAMQFLLQFSGYRLAKEAAMNPAAVAMLNQPLPEIDRTFGPMTLAQGLCTLAGNTFSVLVDPVHRLIAFKLTHAMTPLYRQRTRTTLKKGRKNEDNDAS